MPVHLSDHAIDAELEPIDLVVNNSASQPFTFAMSNSFAFGGNNISLILERKS
jgi:3-oxoacyl-[acyl-carrier-protein] synthase-1